MKRAQQKPIWPAVAAALATRVPLTRLHPAVLARAEQGRARATWCVAFSGGADSLALLLLLWAHWPKRRARLVALHFNHRLRGRAATEDERFCRGVCAALRVKYISGRWAEARPDASEAEARAARMEFFAGHSRVLWLGHQQDDIAETMLMRLARGSGSSGLAAPRPVQPMPGNRTHLRLLLTLKKTEIVGALRAVGAVWREDATNAGDAFFRNRVRRSVLPIWTEAAGRDALAGAALARELIEEDDAALEARVDELKPVVRGRWLELGKLAGQPRAIVRRSLQRWLMAVGRGGVLSRQGFSGLLAAVERGAPTRQSLGADGFAELRGGRLRLVRRKST